MRHGIDDDDFDLMRLRLRPVPGRFEIQPIPLSLVAAGSEEEWNPVSVHRHDCAVSSSCTEADRVILDLSVDRD